MTVHYLSGLPRSGTTLLANILAQHPDLSVHGTSSLYNCVEAVVTALSNSQEVQSELANRPGTYDRYLTALRGLVDGFHPGDGHHLDKSRGWLMQPHLISQLDPASALIVCVRDPRDVVASIERQHRNTAAFHSPIARTLAETAETLMVPTGMVGGAMRFIEDLVRRRVPATFVRYESLVVAPEPILARVWDAIGLSVPDHDLDSIENVATDLDALTRNKYPHVGAGTLKPQESNWRDTISDDIANRIALSYPLYMQTFGYQEN